VFHPLLIFNLRSMLSIIFSASLHVENKRVIKVEKKKVS